MSSVSAEPAVAEEFDPRWQMVQLSHALLLVCDGADCIVALARAAPHLLMLVQFPFDPQLPVFCEHAFEFLPEGYFRGKRVVLFDDTINFGSTMADVKARLERLGARVECFAAAVDASDFLGESDEERSDRDVKESPHAHELRASWHQKLAHRDVQVFHNAEVQAFRTLAKPYNVDFPIFELRLAPTIRDCVPAHLSQLMGESPPCPFFYPYTYHPHERELYPITIPLRSNALREMLVNDAKCIDFQPYSKIRLYFDYDRLVLRFAPMVQIHTSGAIEHTTFADPGAERIWTILRGAVRKIDDDREERALGFHRALVFAFSVSVGRALWKSVIQPALGAHAESITPVICDTDASLLFGPFCGTEIASLPWIDWPGLKRNDLSWVGFDEPPSVNGDFVVEQLSDPALGKELLFDGVDANTWTPCEGAGTSENLGSMLPYLRRIVDEQQRQADCTVNRLKRGFTFSDLYGLLNVGDATCRVADLSFAIDVLVDRGMLVPQTVFRRESESVIRCYRSGENDASDPTLQLKSIIHKLLIQRQKQGHPPLSEKGFAKVFAVLKLLHDKHFPIALRLRTYGTEPFVDDALLRDWCLAHKIIQLTKGNGGD